MDSQDDEIHAINVGFEALECQRQSRIALVRQAAELEQMRTGEILRSQSENAKPNAFNADLTCSFVVQSPHTQADLVDCRGGVFS